MQHLTGSGTMHRWCGPLGTLWIGLLCVGVFSAGAFAQDFVPPKPKAKAAPKQKAEQQVPPKGQPSVSPGAKAAPGGPSVRQSNKGRGAEQPFTMNPDAKWACDQQSVTLPPTWRGNKPLTWTFEIRNEGTSNLQIKAKGG